MRAEPLEPEVGAALEAIDDALRGEPVDPEFAELAELSLILRDERPAPDPAFAQALDDRVRSGFAEPSAPRTRWWRTWWTGSAAGVLAAAAIVVVAVVLVHGGGSSTNSSGASSSAAGSQSGVTATSGAGGSSSAGSSAGGASAGGASATPGVKAPPSHRALGPAPVPQSAAGRQITQTAQLSLIARPGKVDAIARQVFGVVGDEHGYVAGSEVSAVRRGESTAHFTLQIPSGRLQRTLTRLSRLQGASVSSRSDASRDVTGQIDTARDRLAQARALRRSLLGQLAAATTPSQVQDDQRRLRRNLAAITRDQSSLTHLHHRVSYSTIAVSVSGPSAAPAHHPHGGGGGFTLHRGLHDAGRVLVVAAGVALIVLAVLVPVGVVVALGLWAWALVRRRRREQALGPRG